MTATENNDGILPKIYVIYNRRKTKKEKKILWKQFSENKKKIQIQIKYTLTVQIQEEKTIQ